MRDKSVVRSSVIPSAKYSWSGSRDRFSKANTTKERRGIRLLAEPGGLCGLDAGTVAAGTFRCGQAHQTAFARPIAATSAAAITARCRLTNWRVRAGSVRNASSGVEAAPVVLIA